MRGKFKRMLKGRKKAFIIVIVIIFIVALVVLLNFFKSNSIKCNDVNKTNNKINQKIDFDKNKKNDKVQGENSNKDEKSIKVKDENTEKLEETETTNKKVEVNNSQKKKPNQI